MPGWHEATEQLQRDGKLRMVGIIQEQHPDRCRLFMQWKRMDWPVLVDAHNRLAVGVVPITLLIDEHGIVRHSAPSASRAGELLERFLATSYEVPEPALAAPSPPDLARLERAAEGAASAEAWVEYADAVALWGGADRFDDVLDGYRKALEIDATHAAAEFRLGVTLRRRYDSGRGAPSDFTRAVAHWTRALQLDPNNYVWRRRIQQYGPRLDKPYPFYDWVAAAREEIAARGERPVSLAVEPRGAELTHPSRAFDVAPAPAEPDAEGRILRDEGKYVKVDATLVPAGLRPGGAARVYLEFRPSAAAEAHWNNEVGGLVVWLDPPPNWQVDSRQRVLRGPAAPVSDEPRHVEFEIRSPEDASGPVELPGYALYYVCEGVKGACLYRRQDLTLAIAVAGDADGG